MATVADLPTRVTPAPAPGRPAVPGKEAPFEEKMAFYRSQHTTRGIRATHLVGIPTVAAALPVTLVRPKVGLPMLVGGWALQVLGHRVFEKNSPALASGFLTYQFCGLAFWCEEMVEIITKAHERVG